MNDTAQKQASYDDLLNLPEYMVGEILHGVLHQQPRPAPRHAFTASRMGARLNSSFDLGKDGPGGWWILDEPECHLGADVLVPDIGGWRRENMLALPESAWFELAPDWVCEILSPSTAQKDRTIKQAIYAREGVSYIWFIDPIAQTLEAFVLESGSWVLLAAIGGSNSVAMEPFQEMSFELSELWA